MNGGPIDVANSGFEAFGDRMTAFHSGITEWRRLVHQGSKKSKKRGIYQARVHPQARTLVMALRTEREAALNAMATMGLIIVQQTIANDEAPVLAAAA